MSFCHATADNAQYLAKKTGLSPLVALAWLWNECQSVNNPTNPLNIKYSGTHGQTGHGGPQNGSFGVYASPQAGLDHAAWLINNSAYYGGIRNAIKTGNIFAEARAIELSPWAGGHYGGGSGPGNISSKLSSISGKPITSTAQGSDNTSNSPKPGLKPLDRDALVAALTALGISTSGDYRLTADDAARLNDYLTKKGYDVKSSGLAAGAIVLLIEQGLGQPNSFDPGLTEAANKLVPDIPGAIGAFGGTIIKLVTYILAVVFIVVGLWLYGKGHTEGVSVG